MDWARGPREFPTCAKDSVDTETDLLMNLGFYPKKERECELIGPRVPESVPA